MNLNLSQILSGSALILGLYIILSFFWGGDQKIVQKVSVFKPRENYHVGCYLNEHNTSHYSNILDKIDELKKQSSFRIQKSLSGHPNDYIQSKGVEAAKNFDNFLDQYNKYKVKAQTNIDLLRAVSNAKLDFKNCLRDLNGKGQFSEADCLLDWEAYLRCTTDLNILKNNLNVELSQKNKITQQMKNLLNKNMSKVASSRGPHDDTEKEYRQKDRILEDRQKRLEAEIKLLDQKITHASYNYDKAVNNTLHFRNLYLECSQNRIQFRLCQQLSQQIRNLGYGSFQNLDLKVQRKLASLGKMRDLLDETLKGDQSSQEFKRLYYNSLQEHKKLMKLFVETKAKIIIHCGCTETGEIKLREDMEKSMRQQAANKRQIDQLSDKFKISQRELQDIKLQKKNLLQEFQNRMKKLSSHKHSVEVDPLDLLKKLQRERDAHQKLIIDLQKNFNDHDYRCNRIKDRLTLHVKSLSIINDCLAKYQYYSQIKKRYELDSPKDIKIDQNLKRKLSKSVHQFNL